MIDRLFVYGSLQPGGSNQAVLDQYNGTWEQAHVIGILHDQGWGSNQGYPGLTLDPEGEPVSGYVLTSSDLSENWKALDEFEGSEYKRCLTQVTLSSGDCVFAHVYALATDA